MKKKCILLDLDGTITDSGHGITKSAAYALKKFGIKVEKLEDLNRFIGPPLRDSFKEYYGMSDEEAERAVEYYREYYAEKGMFENELYEGIAELIKELNEKGIRLAVATAKAEFFAVEILKHFGLDEYFEYVSGSGLDGSRAQKSEIIEDVLNHMKIEDSKDVIMVGDREHDIIGAKEHGVECIAVLYGYGDREELENADACYIVKSVDELKSLIDEVC